jgi:hypothetical protein
MRRASGLLVLGLIMLVILSNVTDADEITLDEGTISFTEVSKIDRSIVLDLPRDAAVTYFSFDVSSPVGAGQNQPWNLSLDIGDNGTIDWAYAREYGPIGYQNLFDNNANELESRYIPDNYNRTGGFYLPAGAEVSSATMDIVYSDEHYISPVLTELNRPESHPEAPYDYDPELAIFQDRLFAAYRTYSWHDTNQSDADIVVNATIDGINWQIRPNELTKAPDTEVPYTGGKRAGDFNPSMAVFKDKLFFAWESASVLPIGSTHGSDRDIVWSAYDDVSASSPRELTAPTENAGEDIYSENPGIKDDKHVQLCTFDNGSGEQLFAIWTANNTGDENFPGDMIGDIVVSRTIDGFSWTTGFDLTFDDKRYDDDTSPQMVEFETSMGNALYAFWITNNEKLTNGSDLDIVYRYTFDGINWSQTKNLIVESGIKESNNNQESIDEDLSVLVYDGQLYVLWRTSNPNIADGRDIDIVLIHSSDGFNWSAPIEVTPKSDILFNNRPIAAIHDGNLVVAWRAVKSIDKGAIELRIFYKTTDKWSGVITVSPSGVGGDDYRPDIISFNNKLMVAWVTQDNTTALGEDSDVMVRWLMPRTGVPEVALDIGHEQVYNDNWLMPKTQFIGDKKQSIDLTGKLKELLHDDNWVNANIIKDDFNNDIVFIRMNTYFSSPGRITLKSLAIRYNYTFTLSDLSSSLSGYLKEARKDTDDETIGVKLRFESGSLGKIKISNLKVVYSKPDETTQNPELTCILIIGIILIVAGLAIRFIKIEPKKNKKKPEEPKKKSNS